MAEPKSETHKTADCFGNQYYETKVVDQNGNVYKGSDVNSEKSQEIASEKLDNEKPDWKPGWL